MAGLSQTNSMKNKITLSKIQKKCLLFLAAYHDQEADCVFMNYIAEQTGLSYREVRLAVRALARKGLTEYVRGLFDEDGFVAGSGYRATFEGWKAVKDDPEFKG